MASISIKTPNYSVNNTYVKGPNGGSAHVVTASGPNAAYAAANVKGPNGNGRRVEVGVQYGGDAHATRTTTVGGSTFTRSFELDR